jgi:electron transport complex protein RnfD
LKKRDPDLLLFHAPLLRQGMTTPKAMRDVIYALLPATAAALWFFGLSAALVLASCIAGAVLAEWVFANREERGESLRDATGILTGLLLGLTLPPGLPLWMAFLGGVVAISLGKIIWGGLGHNLFNPCFFAGNIPDRNDNLGTRNRRWWFL